MADKMATWRLNQKNFERRERLKLVAETNVRFRTLNLKLFAILKYVFKIQWKNVRE